MLWDWNSITLLDSVLFTIISVALLTLVGYGILRLICTLTKWSNPLESFGSIAKLNLCIVFGFIFVFLIIFFFSLFNLPYLISSVVIISLAVIGVIIAYRKNMPKLPRITLSFVKQHAPLILVLVILLIVIFLSSMLIAGFYGTTNDDGADHTLMVRILLDNPNALITRIAQPYANFNLNYPSGAHVLSAFILTSLNIPIQKIIIMLSDVLPALIALSFYSTVQLLFEKKILSVISLIIAAFFSFGLSFGPIGWAGLPVLLSLYLTISGIGLIYAFLIKQKVTCLSAVLLGLVFFISLETYPTVLLLISFWFILILAYRFIVNKSYKENQFKAFSAFFRNKIKIILSFFAPLSLGLPYINTFFTGSSSTIMLDMPLNAVAKTSTEIVKIRISFNWLLDIPALSNFFKEFGQIFFLVPFSLILLALFIPKVSRKFSFPRSFSETFILIYLFLLLIMSYLTLTLLVPLNLFSNLLDPQRVWYHIFIPATILTALVLFSIVSLFGFALKRLFGIGGKIKHAKNKLVGSFLLIIIAGSTISLAVPLVAQAHASYENINLSLQKYTSLHTDDLALMNWITSNVSQQRQILVSVGDSGQYLTSVTRRQTVSLYSYFRNYSDLMGLLSANASDVRAIPLLIEYNVSYVYIGSTATTYATQYPWYRTFNASQFVSTPYFVPTKEVGNAWLFEFNASAALALNKS